MTPETHIEADAVWYRIISRRSGAEAATVTEEVAGQVSQEISRLLSVMQGEVSRLDIQRNLNLKGRANFEARYLKPSLDEGFIEMTIPDKPKSRLQKYRLTEKGKRILEQSR